MSYLGDMLSKTYLLKVNDVRVLAILKDLRERGQIEIREQERDNGDGGVHGGRLLAFSSPRRARRVSVGLCGRTHTSRRLLRMRMISY